MDIFAASIALRWAVIVLGVFAAAKAVRGFVAFGLGDQWLSTFVRSVVFLHALTLVTMQYVYFTRSDPPVPQWSTISTLLLQTLTCAYVLWGLIWLRLHPTIRFKQVYRHLDHALAISDLANVDPDAAAELAETARRLTAEALMRGELAADVA